MYKSVFRNLRFLTVDHIEKDLQARELKKNSMFQHYLSSMNDFDVSYVIHIYVYIIFLYSCTCVGT